MRMVGEMVEHAVLSSGPGDGRNRRGKFVISNNVTIVDFQIIKNQEYLLVRIFNKSLEKLDQRLGIHLIFVYHETYLALVDEQRNQINLFATSKHSCAHLES